ncbi:MAG: polysaccharide biosynthesis protein [Planctomycetes bacterium]|nr:polysaccharide biosynthesis protein [Planctomycetota bacterium]
MDESEQSIRGAWTAWTRAHRLLMVAAAHAALFAVTWLMAFGLAYNFSNFGLWIGTFFLRLLPIVVVVKLAIFAARGLLRGSWRYVSMRDVLQVTFASWLGFVAIFALYYGASNLRAIGVNFNPFEGQDFPDSVFLLDFAGTIALVSGARIAVRLYHEEVQPVLEGAAPKLLILGAGNAGENVVREMNRQPVLQYRIVGFLDDDQAKWGATIHGVPVFGSIDKIREVCAEHAIDEILVAMPSATRAQVRRVIDLAQGTNLRFKTLPAIADLVAGRAQVQQIRDVDINDLLGRAPVQLDTDQVAKFIRARVVVVTGAGGSIGSEMCRQICSFRPERLLLIEQAEQNLFEIDRELRTKFPELTFVPYIADIADAGRVAAIFERERPSAVFHAAAHKHVPMMEYNPGEAVKNNVRGTMTVASVAAQHGVEKFVMISTDKAVNPTSIMGGSKRLAEMYIQALNDRVGTEFITVRFGNVLGSSGSVIPIFKDQIRRGGPVTVTHPDMVRYFMTIPEAAQLVLQSASMGHGGEIYVLDMGEPVKILDLARDLITLSGFRPGEDIEIVFTGMRPGEKLFEELSIEGEDVSRTAHPKIGIWRKKAEEWTPLVAALEHLIGEADGLSRETLRDRLKHLVPEFHLETPAAPKHHGASAAVDELPDEAAPGVAPA